VRLYSSVLQKNNTIGNNAKGGDINKKGMVAIKLPYLSLNEVSFEVSQSDNRQG